MADPNQGSQEPIVGFGHIKEYNISTFLDRHVSVLMPLYLRD